MDGFSQQQKRISSKNQTIIDSFFTQKKHKISLKTAQKQRKNNAKVMQKQLIKTQKQRKNNVKTAQKQHKNNAKTMQKSSFIR